MCSSIISASPKRNIPDRVLIGYTNGNNYTKVKDAVMEDGVNVVIWSFMDIRRRHQPDSSLIQRKLNEIQSSGYISTNLDLQNVKTFIAELDKNEYSHVLHLTSFGGWDGPHLDPSLTAQEWYRIWKYSDASNIFHGIDFDLEGNDNLASPNNLFTIDCLKKMGEISKLMKEDGYIVSMAPPQSYLNFNNSAFSRYVNISTPERRWHSEFHYFGANVYAYLLAQYVDYIDLVSVQLYESYSDAGMSVHHNGVDASNYIFSFVHNLVAQNESFKVNFDQDPTINMNSQRVYIPISKLVIGLANGWAINNNPISANKTLYISGTECKTAYTRLKKNSALPRGFMFWTIEERGTNGVYLARDIGKWLYSSEDNGRISYAK
jgi:chitinase